jgi:hypothetical protein
LSHRSDNTDKGARVDIAADGFWGPGRERTFLDIRVFNPYAPSNRNSSLSSTYRQHEREKRRQYGQRVSEIEHGSFTPLVFSLTGGMAKETTVFYKRLTSLLSEKWDQPYSDYGMAKKHPWVLSTSIFHSMYPWSSFLPGLCCVLRTTALR